LDVTYKIERGKEILPNEWRPFEDLPDLLLHEPFQSLRYQSIQIDAIKSIYINEDPIIINCLST
jgi:hypothetical protein